MGRSNIFERRVILIRGLSSRFSIFWICERMAGWDEQQANKDLKRSKKFTMMYDPPLYLFLICRLRNRERTRNWRDKICLERDKSLVVVMLVMMDGIVLLVQKSIIGLEICRRLGLFERVVPVVLVLKQVNSIP